MNVKERTNMEMKTIEFHHLSQIYFRFETFSSAKVKHTKRLTGMETKWWESRKTRLVHSCFLCHFLCSFVLLVLQINWSKRKTATNSNWKTIFARLNVLDMIKISTKLNVERPNEKKKRQKRCIKKKNGMKNDEKTAEKYSDKKSFAEKLQLWG